ncbi:MAG: hypothetical protein A2826_02865 [Candidatus Doudnabacteria bacterium RIFCSPHIGHO2_01_FULL_43_23]|uniref:Prepilin peptidase n=1 Tax=Candidatus Doudnabacteria bacterium RIFCSPHIGHO2_01_FULL_43_23 TaxID=1817822 RepID=A0A1F5NRX9_9BACT|nr:MAG: hypothetical protein A2826_02865 [Candidatus Doudnabacteria bacterium RIFCSPHIGHO2_01_FULL_43_23]
MQIFFLLISFVFGLIIGSFLNAVIYRLYKGKSLGGFSACVHCKHRLFAKDLIPILSFFMLGAKCRYCKEKISWQYPIVELSTGIVFALFTLEMLTLSGLFTSGDYLVLMYEFITASLLIAIFTFDFKYYLIPDVLVLSGVVVGLVYRLTAGVSIFDGLLGAGLIFGFFGLLYLMSGGKWIGFGDVKLGLFLGIVLGVKMVLLMLMLAYISGAVVGVVMILAKKTTMKGILPFGTFLTSASLAVMLWGEELLAWYLNLF